MKTILKTAAAALLLTASTSFALTTVDVTNQLQTQGYTQITVKKGAVKSTITAMGPNGTRTVVFNQITGMIISDTGAATTATTAAGTTTTRAMRGDDDDGREGHSERDDDHDDDRGGDRDGDHDRNDND